MFSARSWTGVVPSFERGNCAGIADFVATDFMDLATQLGV